MQKNWKGKMESRVLSPGSSDRMIRKAVIEDIKPIHKMLSYYAEKGLLLPRSLSDLYDHLRDHFVIEDSHDREGIIGVCALGISWEHLGEIRSLAIVENQQGRGLGSRLVETCLQEARSLGLMRVFTLTYVPDFFNLLGFKVVEKAALPQKIWADCLKCPKFPDCDETAMTIELSDKIA